jgi:hypothetical protein
MPEDIDLFLKEQMTTTEIVIIFQRQTIQFTRATLYPGYFVLIGEGSGGKSTQLSYLSKSKDTLIENYSSKSHPVKYFLEYLSKSLKVFGFKYT